MKRTLILLVSTVLVAGVVAQTGRAEYQVRMTGIGKGKAKFKVRSPRQAELEVEGENSLRNTAMTVRVGALTYTTTSDALGRFRVTDRFGANNMPTIGLGTAVSVTHSGGLVMSGSF